jgi:hypothetical protein
MSGQGTMNRQARKPDSGTWIGFGAVTFQKAAIEYAYIFADDGDVIQVRDESEPEVIHTLTVERVTEYRVSRLRGGE